MPFTLADSAIYADGVALDTVKHNNNLYSNTSPDQGIYSKINGHVSLSDFASGAEFDRSHIWPGELVRAHSESMLSPAEYFSDSAPVGTEGPSGDPDWSPIPGASIRFYAPYPCMALFDINAYLSFWRAFYVNDRSDSGDIEKYNGREYIWYFKVRLTVDQSAGSASYYNVPLSAQVSPSQRLAGGYDSEGDIRCHEYGQGFSWSQHRLVELDAGWHSAQLEYKMSVNGSKVFAGIKRGAKKMNNSVRYYQRLFAGIRSARVLTLSRKRDT